MMGEQLFESVISAHSAFKLVHKLLVSLFATILLDTLAQVVHLDITGVNKALAGLGFSEKVHGVHVRVGHVFLNCGHLLATSDRLVIEATVTEVLYWRALGQSCNSGGLLAECLDKGVVGLGIMHPVYRELISETRADRNTSNGVLRAAVCSPG